jgi:hypothetical protein
MAKITDENASEKNEPNGIKRFHKRYERLAAKKARIEENAADRVLTLEEISDWIALQSVL